MKPLRIGFFAQHCLPVHARSLEERPLGGTETGLIRVAAALQARGHQVSVFSSHPNPPKAGIDYPQYFPASLATQAPLFDLLVTLMDWRPLFYGIKSCKNYFWTGDSFDQYINFGMGDQRVVNRADRFLAVSNWQADTLCNETGFPREKTRVIGNGVDLSYFAGSEVRQRKRLIYTSAPYRGLAFTPALLQELQATMQLRASGLEFEVFAGLSIYDRDKPFEGPEKAQYQRIAQTLSTIPGVHLHGNVKQQQLAREFMKSSILFYPNIFTETSCIGVLEAQAAGCAIVTSARGALPETVGEAGLLVSGEPGSKEYMKSFVEATIRLLSDDTLWNSCSLAGLEHAKKELSWERVTDRFEGVLREDFGE